MKIKVYGFEVNQASPLASSTYLFLPFCLVFEPQSVQFLGKGLSEIIILFVKLCLMFLHFCLKLSLNLEKKLHDTLSDAQFLQILQFHSLWDMRYTNIHEVLQFPT